MPSIYKRTKKLPDGRTVEARTYTVEANIGGVWRRLPGYTDAKASAELGRKVERLAALRASGEQPDASLRAWRDSLTGPKLRAKLLKYGLLDGCAVESAKPLTAHVDDFRQ